MPVGDRRGDGERDERAREVQDRGQRDRQLAAAARAVEIEVATAFAVSWKPLVKSNASAVPTTIQRTMSESTPL